MNKLFLLAGTLYGGLGVMIGAFGAHGLKDYLTKIGKTDTFEKGVHFQFFHALALIAVGVLMTIKVEDKLMTYSGWCFLAGTFIFSGSLYILCMTNVNKWGAVTPIGGTLFIVGWTLMFISIWKNF